MNLSPVAFSGIAATLLAGIFSAPACLAGESVPSGYASAARAHGIPADIFYAVALTESGKVVDRYRTRRPWPWTLNVGGKGYFYASREDAYQALRRFLAQGKRSIDIGLMQVNWRWHRDKLGDPWQALDPDHNLQVSARILATCYRERRDRWDAVGCYHAPNNRKFARRYRRNVAAHWRRIARRG
jgi:soluble lytic murein transglycosylase-like protein